MTAKQRAFSSFFTRLHIGRFKAAPYKSSKWSLAKVSVSSVSRIDIGTFFRFMMKQQLKKRKICKQMATVVTISIQSHFVFHMGAAQIWDFQHWATLDTLESGKRKPSSPVLKEFERSEEHLRFSWKFQQRSQYGRVTEDYQQNTLSAKIIKVAFNSYQALNRCVLF